MILDPCGVVAILENTMLNCSLSVCENDFMHMSEGCFTNDLVELLKTKKHARIFVHMLEYFENQNHVLHSSISESKSLIKKYKRENRMLCEMIESLKMKGQSERSMKPDNEFLFEGQECLSHVSLFVHTSLKVFNACLWYLDSGCSRHMTEDKSLFKTLKEKVGDYVTFGDGSL